MLLPSTRGWTDPVAELRAACLAAVAWLVEAGAGHDRRRPAGGELDVSLGEELLAGNVEGLQALSRVLTPGHRATMDYEADPWLSGTGW